MEFSWFAICTILAFIPWILAEEKLLYQTPNENRWGGWETTSKGMNSLNVIELVFCCCCFTQYPDYKHLICQRVALLWCSGCIIVDPPSLSKDTFVRRAHFSKYNIYFLLLYQCYFKLIIFKIVLLICTCWAPYCCCSLVRGWLLVT